VVRGARHRVQAPTRDPVALLNKWPRSAGHDPHDPTSQRRPSPTAQKRPARRQHETNARSDRTIPPDSHPPPPFTPGRPNHSHHRADNGGSRLTRWRGRGFPLGAGLGPRYLPQMLARLERRMRATRNVVEVPGGQQWDERMYAYGSSAPARTQGSLRVWVSALGPAALEARSCGHATPAGTRRAEKCIGSVTIGQIWTVCSVDRLAGRGATHR